MVRKLLLVRHARIGSEDTGRYLGATDLPLSPQGLQQAQRLAARLKPWRIDRCFCSPLARARQTAQCIAASTGIAIQIDADLREVNFGEWEGKTFAEAAALEPEAVARWAQFSEEFAFPGGESLQNFLARIRHVAQRLTVEPAEAILVVTHGGVIRALICHLLGLAPKDYLLFEMRCATLTTIELFEGRGVLTGLNEALAPEET